MKKLLALLFVVFFFFGFKGNDKDTKTNPPIYIAFLWHMHQPIYWPYENVVQTQANSRYPFNVIDIFNQRIGPYTSWPRNAVQKGIDAGLGHLGAQVSFSGSLIENLNNLEAGGNGNFANWKTSWNDIKNKKTSLNNPRIDMVGFGYFHPLMGLIDSLDIRKQIQFHRSILSQNFPGLPYSKGMFPPENAFSQRMIPALVNEGIQWILVDNVHFDRSCKGYPFSTVGNIYEPNLSDQTNPNPNDWVALNGLWAPTRNSARWGRQPHYTQYVDPNTGNSTKMIVVPADRYMGNEDGRGGFGALNYENVMSQLESYNTDPSHPILIVLHHDGDNYGGGSDSYYGSNFQSFVNWLVANPSRFVCTTVQDYLQMYPPDSNDIIHVEDGSWSGADNGDPQFKKWLGDPDNTGYSPDRNSWGVITAAKNLVSTAEQIDSANQNTKDAWKYLLVGESSDYWYWDGSLNGIWDSQPTRAANQAIQYAQQVSGADHTPPTIFLPQRKPYNPGGTEWNINQPKDINVWSYVYDKSGLTTVNLKYRIDSDSLLSMVNYTYAGGSGVGAWQNIPMTGVDKISTTNPAPLKKAKEYSSQITGLSNKLIDYYVEAVDSTGNVGRSPILHCWIGTGSGSTSQQVSWSPVNPSKNDVITITATGSSIGAKLHWGVNNTGGSWIMPDSAYWPAGTTKFDASAVESPFQGPDSAGTLRINIGPFNNVRQNVDRVSFVLHYNDNTWNNNSNANFNFNIGSGGTTTQSFVIDGTLDTIARNVSTNNGTNLYVALSDPDLYIATQTAPAAGNDVFIFITDSLGTLVAAPWAKAGKVAKWGAYLANESTNNYCSWFDYGSASVQKASGTVLEGTINLRQKFGYLPTKLYIAVGQYATADGGVLKKQVPAGNGNGDIEANEFYGYSSVVILNLTALIEGFYNTSTNTMIADTMRVYLHNSYPPYNLVDQSTLYLGANGQATSYFTGNSKSDSSYYLQLLHRNALETWSKNGVAFSGGTTNYDFTTSATQAYGDNLILRGSRYCLYGGDVNNDGTVDLSDMVLIDNDSYFFVTGYTATDVNGDETVDISDMVIVDNNSYNFVTVKKPGSAKVKISHLETGKKPVGKE